MNKIKIVWQRLRYNIFIFNVFTQRIIHIPFAIILKNKHVINFYEKKGISDPEKFVIQGLTDPKLSVNSYMTDISMITLTFFILWSIVNIISGIIGDVITSYLNKIAYILLFGIPSIAINCYLLWNNDEHFFYLKKFSKEPKKTKRKWAWISFLMVVAIILFLYLSFVIMTAGVHR